MILLKKSQDHYNFYSLMTIRMNVFKSRMLRTVIDQAASRIDYKLKAVLQAHKLLKSIGDKLFFYVGVMRV